MKTEIILKITPKKVFIFLIIIEADNSKKRVSNKIEKMNTYVNDFDNKPIKASNNKNNEMLKVKEYPDDEIVQDTQKIENVEEEIKENPKRPAKIKRQKPKYDARKAIEEAKQRELNKEKEQDQEQNSI